MNAPDPDNSPATEAHLADNRHTMTLGQRVATRRLIDALAGEQYPTPAPTTFRRLARIMEPGLRRAVAIHA